MDDSLGSHVRSLHGNTARASAGSWSSAFMSQSQRPVTLGTDATATSSARSPAVPPAHASRPEEPDVTIAPLSLSLPSSLLFGWGTVPKRDPVALLRAPRVASVVSGLLTVIGGSAMNPSPKMDPLNRASKSSRHSPVDVSRKPRSDIGTMSIRIPGGKGTPSTVVVRPHTGGPSNVDTSKSRWSTSPLLSVTTPSVVAPLAS